VRSRRATGRAVEWAARHDGLTEDELAYGDRMANYGKEDEVSCDVLVSASGGLCGIVPCELDMGWGTPWRCEARRTGSGGHPRRICGDGTTDGRWLPERHQRSDQELQS